MTLRNLILTAHILAAIVTIGWLTTQGMIVPAMIRRGPSSAAFVRGGASYARKFGPASSLVFFLGIWLVLRDSHDLYTFSQGWISAAMLLFIVAAVIGAVFIGKAEERAAEKLEAGQPALEEARRISMLAGIDTLILIVIVYLMVAKPGM